jgi:hypothetical protein
MKYYAASVLGNETHPYVATSCKATNGYNGDCNATMGYYADATTTNRNNGIRVSYFLKANE